MVLGVALIVAAFLLGAVVLFKLFTEGPGD